MNIDISKQYKTRNGRKVTILKTDVKHPRYPVLALVENHDKEEVPESYTFVGKYQSWGGESSYDLFEVKPPAINFIPFYGDGITGGVYDSLKAAECNGTMLGVIKTTEFNGTASVEFIPRVAA